MRKENELLKRVKIFSINIIRLTEILRESRVNKIIFNQVVRSGTSGRRGNNRNQILA